MPKVVSVIPAPNNSNRGAQLVNGSKVLLDDGTYLQGVVKVTLVAEYDNLWKAVIEVHPTNQQQIDAVIQDIKTIGSDPDQYQYEV
ncbi:hypothetical protein [Acinetobacter guillouiae]|uniref:hypothetical protein n=1 Tax=Acinetobacter guillouiae TaxID=106649 RepID=UPI0004EF60BF|nr:hypothetical protein [Acinetobacter guillouiae]BAP36669.1 hypothetical protein AS4_17290 [Acinetobacter guillouiae]